MRYRRGTGSLGMAGYTITEVLIVLAVTTVMFSAVAITFNGRQARTEFTQAVRSYEAQLQNTISEVTSGNYQIGNCSAPVTSGAPSLSSNTPGSCIFVGKVYANYYTPANTAVIRTLVGRRTTGDPPRDVVSLSEAEPVVVTSAVQNYAHSFQLEVRRVYRLDSSPVPTQIHGFGFLVPFAGSAAISTDTSAGNRQAALYGLVNGSAPSNLVPMPQGILICLRGQNGQRAEITVGASGSQSLLASTLDTPTTKEPCRGY